MRRPPVPLFLLPLLLIFLLPCSEAAKKKTKPKSEDESPAAGGRSALASGELSTKEGHRCTWEAQEGRNNNILLQVSCSDPSEEGEESRLSYGCQFSGKPQECPAYVDKPAQYWKQVVGKLKKRTNACEGEKVLKTRLCKKAPAAAHMKLAERKGEGQNEGGKKKVGNKEGEKEKEKLFKGEMKEEEEELMQGDSVNAFGEVSDSAADMEPAESYCGEGWHTVCRFFTKLLDG